MMSCVDGQPCDFTLSARVKLTALIQERLAGMVAADTVQLLSKSRA